MKYGDIGARKDTIIKLVDGQPRARVANVSPAHTMYERGSIDVNQFSAAKDLYHYYVIAWNGNTSYEIKERVDGGGKVPDITSRQIHAMKQYEKAKKALINKGFWSIINQVVIEEIPATNRDMNGNRRRKVMQELRIALDLLSKVYGYI